MLTMEQIQTRVLPESNQLILHTNEHQKLEQKQMVCQIYSFCSQILNIIYSQKEFREEKLKKIQIEEKAEEFMSFGLITEEHVSIQSIENQLKEIQVNLNQTLNFKNKYIEELQKRQSLLKQQNYLFQSKIMMHIKNYDSKRRLSEQDYNQKELMLNLQSLQIDQLSKIDQANNLSSTIPSLSTLSSLGRLSLVQEEILDNLEAQKVNSNLLQFQQQPESIFIMKKENQSSNQPVAQQSETDLDLDFLKIKQKLQGDQQENDTQEANMFFSDKIVKLSRSSKTEENFICLDKNYFYVLKDLNQLKQNKRFPIKDITKIKISSHDQCEIQIKKEYSLIISISTRQLLINYIISIFKNILKVKPPQIIHSKILAQKRTQSDNLSNNNLISNSQVSLNGFSASQLQCD
ncbi:hypothetical protein TTHERM_00122130 (macronuclear) [Tetrahymena thermophila SB210]|uniref:Uncharacterized protein n=1 Tax=Tetrahymena thermophila (strain SB210) TaxID=312017 RepID=Q22YV7_TETTS|nr:hypothetical protein TTHERM_00122130 [Tetrahymena thermophila SB210]EAR90564.2 hypothetical protein TTHERM_00122130 [Tetrahymena thermophila SB210]|eukprot:XP_001010809.2 hypothetical protein TTHERM_00122130 [Tetrahymena thermophila SB210]